MRSKLREEIEAITPEGGGVSAEEAARTRDMLLDYVQWKAQGTGRAGRAGAPPAEREAVMNYSSWPGASARATCPAHGAGRRAASRNESRLWKHGYALEPGGYISGVGFEEK
jgi:hypothetical protein